MSLMPSMAFSSPSVSSVQPLAELARCVLGLEVVAEERVDLALEAAEHLADVLAPGVELAGHVLHLAVRRLEISHDRPFLSVVYPFRTNRRFALWVRNQRLNGQPTRVLSCQGSCTVT